MFSDAFQTVLEESMKGRGGRSCKHFLVSRIVHGLPYHPVNRTQRLALKRLLNEARRIVTGFPRYTRLEALKSCSLLNDLSEITDTHRHTQEAWLRSTVAGRDTLHLLGYNTSGLP